MDKINWIYDQHRNINHKYDNILPYEFHLELTYEVALEFCYLLKDSIKDDCLLASRGHDLLEDTHCSYNDIKKVLGEKVADIIYAVSNEKGKTRKERANEKYYEGTFFYTDKDILLTICNELEKEIGDIKEYQDHINVIKDILSKISPYNEMRDKLKQLF